jgi:hypothetical protein
VGEEVKEAHGARGNKQPNENRVVGDGNSRYSHKEEFLKGVFLGKELAENGETADDEKNRYTVGSEINQKVASPSKLS